jgi:hypothetical protein
MSTFWILPIASTLHHYLQFHQLRHQVAGPMQIDAKSAATKLTKAQRISEVRRQAAFCRWRRPGAKRANAPGAKFASPRARVISSLEEVELEKELETPPDGGNQCRETPTKRHGRTRKRGSKRGWVDRDTARAGGSDRYWSERVGAIYWLVKAAFLSQHVSPQAYFWSRLDALELGQFLERRPNVALEDVRGMLINYHASDRVHRGASAQQVFRVLQDYTVLNPQQSHREFRKPSLHQPGVSPETLRFCKLSDEEQERESYVMWLGMSPAFQAANPWRGRVFEGEGA